MRRLASHPIPRLASFHRLRLRGRLHVAAVEKFFRLRRLSKSASVNCSFTDDLSRSKCAILLFEMLSLSSPIKVVLTSSCQMMCRAAITIKLRQVPWDQALSIIMKSRSLGYVRQNGVLRIAPLRQLQVEIEEARRILDAQEATLPLKVKVIPVSFASVALLATQIRATLQGATSSAPGGAPTASSSRGRIEADPRSSSLIVTDTEDNVKRIEQLRESTRYSASSSYDRRKDC